MMKANRSGLKTTYAVVATLAAVLWAPGAQAYLDPGSGGLLLQLLLGGIAGLAVAARLYWHRILVFLHIREPLPAAVEDNEVAEDDTPRQP